ncbi:hypothetical protein GLOTRDRAFT_127204 [Gloeophyllum trabeum ATCC 11539]|uniref:Retrotransposon gag domain-containing protein n=1 Tax=Gloeophyllum trabeum (strain ATCC 11539 / FP-39264 / Madison 617) TaxID=670483 RepID=S7RZ38_GLOTA|nr:uncharacterized protein GLOTRDRAFT_127204 [Gloeophyllum trabeum ATCC 11539]EPQ58709.1 hypothetical protein GLOTRDRAFT_127204 [Gloeophyllum trabeum ATCC 11539]
MAGNNDQKEKKGHVAKPEYFDGNKDKFKAWWRQVLGYLRNNKKDFDTDDEKIDFVISYLRGPKAENWSQNYYDQFFKDDTENWDKTWAAFKTDITTVFQDSNLAAQAQIKIDHLRQGQRPVEEYFQELEILMTQAGYRKEDQYILKTVRTSVNDALVDKVYGQVTVPTTYDGWKDVLIKLDNAWRERQQEKAMRGLRTTPPKREGVPTTNQTQPAPRAQPTQKRDGTGTTYLGTGQPMDVDRACLKCKAKQSEKGTCGSTWHVPNRTGKTTSQVRQVDWTKPTSDFISAIKEWSRKDPEGFKAAGFGFGTA